VLGALEQLGFLLRREFSSCVCQIQQKKFGIWVGVMVEKQKVNQRGASLMFPPGVWGQRPQFTRLLIDDCSCRSQFQAVQLALFLFGQRFHVEVTMGLQPTFMDLDRQRPDQP
jgi:hypothetical protein